MEWLICGIIFVVVATTISDPRYVRAMLWAFALGGAASVSDRTAHHGLDAIAQCDPELHPGRRPPVRRGQRSELPCRRGGCRGSRSGRTARHIRRAASTLDTRRLDRDPGLWARWPASHAAACLRPGGGTAALVLFKRQRLAVGAILAVVVTVERCFSSLTRERGNGSANSTAGAADARNSGRWPGASPSDHPVVGVGLDNFLTQEAKYVRQPGVLTSVAMIAEKPHVVHNQYLEAYTETGIIGFVLLISMMLGFLSCGVRAAKGFDARGQPELATLARAVVVAEVSVYVALFFLSDGPDERFWILFGIGAAMLGLASRASQSTDLPISQSA